MSRNPVIVLDNGGATIKLGLQGDEEPIKIVPNCTAKVKGERQQYVGDVLLDLADISSISLRRPIERGYVTNWDLQKDIWNRCFKCVLKTRPSDCCLMLSEPVFDLPSIRESMYQVVFEYYNFCSLHSCPAPAWSVWKHMCTMPNFLANRAGVCLVVDAGFSFTHVLPFFDGRLVEKGVKRIDLGGKLMTNYFKELVSFRSMNVMDETYLVDQIKDTVCFVSQDVQKDLDLSRPSGFSSPYRAEYVLPDGVNNVRGYLRTREQSIAAKRAAPNSEGRTTDQVLMLNNERFMVSELLFRPSDIGLDQAGLPEAVLQAVNAVPEALHGLLYSNVLLTGGCASCPGFKDRFIRELRPMVPDTYDLNVFLPQQPIANAWQGGAMFAADDRFHRVAITKQHYEEHGVPDRALGM